MGFASDVTEGDFLLNMIGKQRLWLENYEALLVYNDEEIVLEAKKTRIRIQGKRLSIESYGSVEMKVTGCIESVSFV